MSDTFDHELDAWESYDRAFDEGYRLPGYGRTVNGYVINFEPDPLFYFTKCRVVEKKAETLKAELLILDIFKYDALWIPKGIIKKRDKDFVYIHTKTLTQILKTYCLAHPEIIGQMAGKKKDTTKQDVVYAEEIKEYVSIGITFNGREYTYKALKGVKVGDEVFVHTQYPAPSWKLKLVTRVDDGIDKSQYRGSLKIAKRVVE